MKNELEIKERLMLELKHWFSQQAKNPYADFYLYYMPQTAEHDSGLLIAREAKTHILVLSERIRKGDTIEQNFNRLYPYLRKLPLLSV